MRTFYSLLWLLVSQLIPVLTSSPPSTCLTGAAPFVLSSTVIPGFYSPLFNASDPNTFPVACPATDDCLLERLTFQRCDAQGVYEPVLCPAGFYCPTPNTMLECTENHFCPIASVQPTRCPALSACPAGASRKEDYSSVLAVFLADMGVVAIWFGMRWWKRRHCAFRDAQFGSGSAVDPHHADGDKPQLSPTTRQLCEGFTRARGDLPPMRIEFEDLSLVIPVHKQASGSTKGAGASKQEGLTILTGVTGSIEPGKVTAVMGPSGAGKTTFLNVLLGKTDPSWQRGGVLRVNGNDEPLHRFSKVMGFVPQEDIMHRDLSGYDNIRYSAQVRLPRDWTSEQREAHAAACIAALQLEHVQDTIIGDEIVRGISGGQRKRVNVGIEMAAAPLALFLDEPTSGLDSTAAMEICATLKDLARIASLTVVMVVHQPRVEIWEQLDELLLLAPGGLTVYQGPQRLVLRYFKQRLQMAPTLGDNPADWLMDRIAEHGVAFTAVWRDGGKEIVDKLREDEANSIVRVSQSNAVLSPLDDKNALAGLLLPGALPPMSADHTVVRTPDGDHIIISPTTNEPSSLRPAVFPQGVKLRQSANFFKQMWLALSRSIWKQAANLPALALEVGLGLVAGVSMAALTDVKWQTMLLPPFTLLSSAPLDGAISALFQNIGLAIALAATTAGVKVFGEEMTIYKREVSSGHSHLAYFIGVNIAQFPRLFISGLHFAFAFHLYSQPLTRFGPFFAISFLLYAAVHGLSCLVSMVVSRKNAPLLGTVLALLMGSMTAKGGFPEEMQQFSAARWATEAMFSYETALLTHVMDVAGAAERLGYVRERVTADLAIMFSVGMFYRLVAYVIMRWNDRKLMRG